MEKGLPVKGIVLEQRKVCAEHFLLRLEAPSIASKALPGQFVHLRVSGTLEPFLRRPLSIHNVVGDKEIWLFYRIVGRGTKMLTSFSAGSSVDIFGPLGRGFSWGNLRRAVIVAGGTGLAPLYFLACQLMEEGKEVEVFIGAKTANLLPGATYFHPLAVRPSYATEDGSRGWHGSVVDLLSREMKHGLRPNVVFACGPRPMLAALKDVASKSGIRGQVSLEERMACGVGACLGCPVMIKSKEGEYIYRRVCSDGPVFDLAEVVLRGR